MPRLKCRMAKLIYFYEMLSFVTEWQKRNFNLYSNLFYIQNYKFKWDEMVLFLKSAVIKNLSVTII